MQAHRERQFVGRVAELDALSADLLRCGSSGVANVAVIVGVAGVGKTALVEELARRVKNVDVTWLRASDVDPGSVARLLGDADAAGSNDVMAAVPEERTSLMVVDDLHWASAEDVRALRALINETEFLSAMIVVTLRPPPHSDFVSRFVEGLLRQGARLLELSDLSAGDVAALARATLGAAASSEVVEWLGVGGGHPLWVTELIRAVEREPASVGRRPPTIAAIVRERVHGLGRAAMCWLPAAAVLAEFDPGLLAEVSAVAPSALHMSLQEAAAAGLLVADGPVYRFRHELLREVVYDDVGAPLRGVLHRQAAIALQASGTVTSAVLAHADRAALATAADVDWLVDVATRGARDTPARAVGCLRRVIAAIGDDDPRREVMLARLVTALTAEGRSAEAEQIARAVLDQTTSHEARELALIGLFFLLHSRPRELEVLATQVAEATDTPLDLRAVALYNLAVVQLLSGRVVEAAATSSRALGLGESRYLPDLGPLLIAMRSLAHAGRGATAEALAELPYRNAPPGPGVHPRQSEPMVHLIRGCLRADLDDLDAAVADMSTAAGLILDREPAGASFALSFLAFVHLLAGDLASAALEAERARQLAPEGLPEGETADVLLRSVMRRLATLTGTGSGAPSSDDRTDRHDHRWALMADTERWAVALDLERGGDIGGAFDVLLEAWERAREARYLLSGRVIGPDLVRLAMLSDHHQVAEAVAADLGAAAQRCDTPSARGVVLRCDGWLRHDPGLLQDAAALYDAAGRRLEAASVMSDAAALSLGNRRSQRVLLQQAGDRFAAMGAVAESERIASALGSGRPPARAVTGWGAVTDAEHQVAVLVADGLTNREIAARLSVSPHTVATHLRHVFAKLGVRSRAALATAIAHQPAPPG